MDEEPQLIIRDARVSDIHSLGNMINYEAFVYRHLDWRQPLDWIEHEPFYVGKSGSKLVATIACPPDPPNVAWIRLLAISSDIPLEPTWNKLWEKVLQFFHSQTDTILAAIPRQAWFKSLLDKTGFKLSNNVIMLIRQGKYIPPKRELPGFTIRGMTFDDLLQVETLDKTTFEQIWRISETSLVFAYRQAAIASVAVFDGKIVAYQISTSSPLGGHLARLAVHPAFHRKGIGYNLVQNALDYFIKRGIFNISVNTQIDNTTSISLYENIGFQKADEIFPVYEYAILNGYRHSP